MHRKLLILLALAAIGPGLARARARVELTAEPGLAIPLNRFIDTKGKQGDSHLRVTNGVGLSINISLLLNQWEFHYGFNQSRLGSVDMKLPDDAWNAARQALQGAIDVPQQVNADLTGSFRFHSITIGYRFVVMERSGWRLFIPNGLGAAIVTGEGTSRALYGASATLGFGADWCFIPRFPYLLLNTTLRYTFHITEMSQEFTGLSLITGGSPWDASVAMMHTISVNLGLAGRW